MNSDSDESEFDGDYDEDFSDNEYESDDHLSPVARPSNVPYELIPRDSVFSLMETTLNELQDITDISYTILRILLNKYKWDKDRLLERFYDSPKKLFGDANIYYAQKVECEMPKTDTILCPICSEDVERQHIIISFCSHFFCKDCYKKYAKIKIDYDGESQLKCPGYDCTAYIEDKVIFELFSQPNNFEAKKVCDRYKTLIVNAFVSQHRSMLFCSTPDCDVIIKIAPHDHNVGIEVKCRCQEILCSSCGNKWHNPVNCDLLKMWKKKCDDDSETFNWIHANTKECPKCKATIEKDGGCNHVVCRNQACRYEFCWVCLTSWSTHGYTYYNCNRYDAEGNEARLAQENSRAALNRYLFYYNRYHNHLQSLKKEGKLQKCVKKKMLTLMERDMSWVEVQFLQHAVDVLQRSRQILMFTYVFAFYLQKSNPTTIFLDNQANLEQATEKLSEYLEREMPDTMEDISNIKCLVQDRARYCSDRSNKLIEHVHEGYNNDQWIYLTSNI